MPQVITDTAQLQCDKGTTPSLLKVTSQDFCKADDKLLATAQDKKGNENIMPFGICAITKKKCSPSPIAWQSATETDSINDSKILLETSTCACAIGGKISIKDKGHSEHHEANN